MRYLRSVTKSLRSMKRKEASNPDDYKFFNSKYWKATRQAVLQANPVCKCGKPSTDCHHKIDRRAMPDRSEWFNLSNLEALCHSCHSQITYARQRGNAEQ